MRFENFPRRPWKYYPEGWTIYENCFPDYMGDFKVVDTDHMVSKQLQKIKLDDDAVIVDLMASTRALRYLYEHGHTSRKLAVGVDDDRAPIEQTMDEIIGVSFIHGDLNKAQTYRNISEWLGGSKIDLLMERGYGALHFVPTNIHFQRAALSRLWDMLNPDGGLAVLQTPPKNVLERRGIPIAAWQEQLSKAGIYNKFGTLENSQDGYLDYGILILQKNPDALVLPDIMNARGYPAIFQGGRERKSRWRTLSREMPTNRG